MYEHQLLEVEDHFQLQKVGLVVAPDFSVKEHGKWSDFESVAKIVCPFGNHDVHRMHVGIAHSSIRDPRVGIDERWRVVVSFPEANKQQIPKGSKVYVSAKNYETIAGSDAWQGK